MNIKYTALILSILQLTPVIASCSNAADETTVTETSTESNQADSTENDDSDMKSGVPDDLDLGGETINIWYTTAPYSEVETFIDLAGELTGETLDDAIFNANRTVEERLNCTLNYFDSLCESGKTGDEVQKLILRCV